MANVSAIFFRFLEIEVRFPVNMALKRSSEIITVSSRVQQGVANTFEVVPLDLQLNPLDQEVFVVLAVKIDFLTPLPFTGTFTPGVFSGESEFAITTTRPSAMPNLGDSNCIAYGSERTLAGVSTSNELISIAVIDQSPTDTPDANLDYIGICATSDMFLSIDSHASVYQTEVALRIYGYRAKADAATYAALVQSEVLSA